MKTKDVKKAAANDVDLEQITETKEINNDQLIADAQKKIDDLKAQLSAAKDELRKLTGKKSSEPKGPGVIGTIFTLVSESGKTGISKADILAKLVEMFPDRSEDSMKNTINVQVPSRLSREHNIKIEKLENGNFVVTK
ncbi:MAG: hypothetical protein JXR56_02090 [Candidatus Cloacimonetes bacterium]|nr:hypothetical protein [Candidatus Cloacimonadota bacterium]